MKTVTMEESNNKEKEQSMQSSSASFGAKISKHTLSVFLREVEEIGHKKPISWCAKQDDGLNKESAELDIIPFITNFLTLMQWILQYSITS